MYVQAYTKDDGTEVKAHYRSKPDGVESNNLGATSIHKPEPNDKLTGGASEIEKDTEYTDYTVGEPIVDVSTPEKVQELMYPKEIAGVERGEPKTLLQVAQRCVNPEFNPTSDEDDYSINCSSAVFAADMQCRGFDVQAVSGHNQKAQELAADISKGYLDPDSGEPCFPNLIWVEEGESCYDYVQKNYPNNSRGILRYKTKIKGFDSKIAHVIIVGKDNNGKIVAFDPQENDYHEGYDAKNYLDGWININTIDLDSYTSILRIDDKIPDPYYINEVVQKR